MSSPCVGLCMYVYVVKRDVFSLVRRATRTIYAEGHARVAPIALSPAFCVLDARDLRRGLRGYRSKSHSRLYFAHTTRTISAEGCARTDQFALSPAFRTLDTHDLRRGLRAHRTNRTLAAFRALDTHDLRRGLRGHRTNRTLVCISRTRRARSPQRVARTPDKSHSRLHFAHSTRISRTRHARSPQRVARTPNKSHSRLHFAHSTRTISAEGCAHTGQIALSPAFRTLDTHALRRGLRAHTTNRTLACISRTRRARSPQRVAFSVDAVRPTLRL